MGGWGLRNKREGQTRLTTEIGAYFLQGPNRIIEDTQAKCTKGEWRQEAQKRQDEIQTLAIVIEAADENEKNYLPEIEAQQR